MNKLKKEEKLASELKGTKNIRDFFINKIEQNKMGDVTRGKIVSNEPDLVNSKFKKQNNSDICSDIKNSCTPSIQVKNSNLKYLNSEQKLGSDFSKKITYTNNEESNRGLGESGKFETRLMGYKLEIKGVGIKRKSIVSHGHSSEEEDKRLKIDNPIDQTE